MFEEYDWISLYSELYANDCDSEPVAKTSSVSSSSISNISSAKDYNEYYIILKVIP